MFRISYILFWNFYKTENCIYFEIAVTVESQTALCNLLYNSVSLV